MNKEQVQALNRDHATHDWGVSANYFHDLFYGQGSQFRKVLDRLGELDPRAAGAFQRLGEIQVATGSHKPWLVDHHLAEAAQNAAYGAGSYLHINVDCLDNFWLKERVTTLSRFHDFLNTRVAPAVEGLSILGWPEFSDRWDAWKNDFCNGVISAHSLTTSLKGSARLRQRLNLCIDTLKDNLPELREFFNDARSVTGSYAGGWSDAKVMEFLVVED